MAVTNRCVYSYNWTLKNCSAVCVIKLVVLLNTYLVHFLQIIYIHKTDSGGRNNEYMKLLHLYADEEGYVHVLDLTFTEKCNMKKYLCQHFYSNHVFQNSSTQFNENAFKINQSTSVLFERVAHHWNVPKKKSNSWQTIYTSSKKNEMWTLEALSSVST